MMYQSLILFLALLVPSLTFGGPLSFTYLDLIDPSIRFEPIMYKNWVEGKEASYAIFAKDELEPTTIPGYHGQRCIVEVELAKALSRIQKRLQPLGLSLKVYDAYRPQQAVDYFTNWTSWEDTPLVKRFHYPAAEKANFHDLSYLSRTSSHTKGTAVDVTLCKIGASQEVMPQEFLGIWDPESVDMGVGYLCFDERSSENYTHLTPDQLHNRRFLRTVMLDEGFIPLNSEFWHFYYLPERNPDYFYDFPIRDDYSVQEENIILLLEGS